MRLQENFKSVLSYAAGVENWVNGNLMQPLDYTFSSDFAIADWYGAKEVEDTYKRVKEAWYSDYKAFTQAVVAINMLSWAHMALKGQGIEGRDEFIELYSDLYYRARKDFYDKYENNQEACDYFFQMTD